MLRDVSCGAWRSLGCLRHYLLRLTTKSDATVMPIKMGPRNDRRSSVKFVISWQPRSNMTEEMQARSLDVFGKWSPAAGTNFLRFLRRIDGPGGFAVVETDDPALLARDTAIFSTFFDMTV